MGPHWDNLPPRPILSNHVGYHGQPTTFQPPFSEHLATMRPPLPPLPEHHGPATPFGPPFAENNIVPIPYYEGYTIRPDDLVSSDDRWSIPPKKSIPATQEDLHTEVIRQRQSGRTACRELEDCHGPKRQYIDRLVRERNASTSLGHFEVAQLRLERIAKDYGKASNRDSSRSSHARDYKQKDLTKPKRKTVYMHIILQFIKNPSRSLAKIPPDNFAPRDPNVGNGHRSGRHHASDEDISMYPASSDDHSPVSPAVGHGPLRARGYPYPVGNEQVTLPPSSRYTSRGTQTTCINRPQSDCCSGDNTDDATLGLALREVTWTTASSVKEEMPRNSSSTDDEVVLIGDGAAVHEFANRSIEEESRGIDEYEKPPWFQNLQPVKTSSVTDELPDVSYQRDDRESLITEEEKDTDDVCGQDETQRDEDADCAQPSFNSRCRDDTGQGPPDLDHTEHDNHDRSAGCTENEGMPVASETRKLGSVDEHPGSGPTNMTMSEYLSNLQGPPPQDKLPPSERYKPRPPLNAVPARPSLTRASATYDSRPIDDSERKFSKRVSFQQALTPVYTPPSTSTSSPVSPSASPQLPFRTAFTKPPPVSIPPGQYTPIASSSPVSPLSPPAARKPYTCLEPTCDSSFDHPYDRDRHERQHDIGDPPYSECPVCHYSRSSGAAVDVGLREMLIAHISRRH